MNNTCKMTLGFDTGATHQFEVPEDDLSEIIWQIQGHNKVWIEYEPERPTIFIDCSRIVFAYIEYEDFGE